MPGDTARDVIPPTEVAQRRLLDTVAAMARNAQGDEFTQVVTDMYDQAISAKLQGAGIAAAVWESLAQLFCAVGLDCAGEGDR